MNKLLASFCFFLIISASLKAEAQFKMLKKLMPRSDKDSTQVSETPQADNNIPATFHFAYTVKQLMHDDDGKTASITYYYPDNGEYMAMATPESDGNLMIMTKEGKMLVVNNKEKSITIINMKKMMAGIMAKAKDMKMDSSQVSASSAEGNVQVGGTKTIAGYPAKEVKFTDDQGNQGSVWVAKVDFECNPVLLMGFSKNQFAQTNRQMGTPYDEEALSAVSGDHSLMAEMYSNGKLVMETQSIEKAPLDFSTSGYQINDLSNMSLGNMFRQGSNR